MSNTSFTASEQSTIQNTLQSKSILIIDDDPIFRQVTRVCLESYGCRVDEAENGLEGLVKLKADERDLVMCDLDMPILNGIEFVEEVSHAYPSLPIVVVSATEAISDVAQVLKYGIKEFIPKPIRDYSLLVTIVSKVVADSDRNNVVEKDFASQWVRAESEDVHEEVELHSHLDYLQYNPSAARELLQAMLPDNDFVQGEWRISYRLLQTAEVMPLVFDCAWIGKGQFAFYIVDSGSHLTAGVGTSLLVRTLFHDYIRTLKTGYADLKDIAEIIEHGIRCSDCSGAVSSMFGIIDTVHSSMSILPAGLDGRWWNHQSDLLIKGGSKLGDNCMHNFITKNLPVSEKSQVLVHNTGVCSFTLDIMKQITT